MTTFIEVTRNTGQTIPATAQATTAQTVPVTAQTAPALVVNGMTIDPDAIAAELPAHADEIEPDHAARRALVVRALLTQRARDLGLLSDDEDIDDDTTDALIDQECAAPEPTDVECRRYYEANTERFRSTDLAHARHILFALTEDVSMSQLRTQAESALAELQRHPSQFDEMARTLSNCSSGELGGNLGQLSRGETVPEFDAAVFGTTAQGLLPELVRTRHGFHIVLIERRIPGQKLPFDAAHEAIGRYLNEYVRYKAMQQYVNLLVSDAQIEGITLHARAGPLQQ